MGLFNLKVAESISNSVQNFFDLKKREWGLGLQMAGFSQVNWGMGGSLKTGLFTGPKPKSQNPRMPPGKYVEWDGMLYIPSCFDAQASDVISRVESATGLQFGKHSNRTLWDTAPRRSIFYGYFQVADLPGMTVEAELALSAVDDWCEVADYWKDVFNQHEQRWQRATRDVIRRRLNEEAVEAWKQWQVSTARWRMYAGFASGQIPGEVPTLIRHLVQSWFLQPIPARPDINLRLPGQPAPDTWVTDAMRQAWQFRSEGKVDPSVFTQSQNQSAVA